jgi:lipopolysaccharide/colanic/teichoic acid biosynthesis glycosyltransferase
VPRPRLLTPRELRVPDTRRDTGKRAVDVAIAGVALVGLSPLLAVIGLLVKRDSPGPVLFRQRRRGQGGQPFTLLKFRTMSDGASSAIHERYIADAARRRGTRSAGLQKLTQDTRVTRVGRILRATSADELPQLVNVLRGEMSIVGPRPALDYELKHYEPEHFRRFDVKPGLTGLWQVSGRSTLGFREMLDLDAAYARDAGPALDLRILLRTPRALLRGGAA